MNTKAIMTAVFAAAATAPGIVTAERRLKHFARYTDPAQFPVANFWHGKEEGKPTMSGGPSKWTLRPVIYLYFWCADEVTDPDDAICDALDYVRAAFAPPSPGIRNTLGGLVDEVFIDGQITVDEAADLPVQVVQIPICAIVAS